MRDTPPIVPPREINAVIISQDVEDTSNSELVAKFSHKSYELCMQQDLSSDTLAVHTDKLEQLFLESLSRIFAFNGENNVSQFQIYETIEKLFDDQAQYDCIKSISLLRRVKLWKGIDHTDEKYIRWMKSRIRGASRSLCNKLDFIDSQERINSNYELS